MEENNDLIILYDYYQNLLTTKQQQIFEDYYFNNFSLAELSIEYNISRNAIHKNLKSIEEKLKYYDDILLLVNKGKIINEIKSKIKDDEIIKLLEEIE